MELLVNIFNTILYQPLFNALVLLYQFLPGHDFGIAVIVLTLLIRLALSPLMIQSLKSQKAFSKLQNRVQKIQKDHKKNKEQQMKEIISLYQGEKISPLGGCLPLLFQLPVLIALYRVFWRGLQPESLKLLYHFVPEPETINFFFLGIIDLSQPNFFLAFLAGFFQWWQSKITNTFQKKLRSEQISKSEKTLPKDQLSEQLTKQALYFFPIFTILILLKMPAAVGLYWITTILFSILQQYLVYKP
jgi:YidC/Oxa1 family membrane protein insertase